MPYSEHEEIKTLFNMLKAGTSAALTVQEAARQLAEAGFEELEFRKHWELKRGARYYMKHHDTTLFAFTVGSSFEKEDGFRMAAAHTDYPCLRIKPNPDIRTAGYRQLNVEVYGGPILNTWLDRPLSVSGRVAVKSQDVMHPGVRLVDVERPLMVIPNLAIHLNRDVNKGVELNRQTNLLPITGSGGIVEEACGDEGSQKVVQEALALKQAGFLEYLARELGVEKSDILDYELWIKCLEEPKLVGIENDLIVSPRLDNLTSVQALVSGLIGGDRDKGINLIALFDHEEIGSKSKQGAGSLLLLQLLEKISRCFGMDDKTREFIYDSMLLSVDVAQGSHPNYMSKVDPTNQPVLNGGFCIKEACSQSYATDCEAVAAVEQLCQAKKIPYQKFVNRSDVTGGGTLGAIASSIIPVPTVDIGVPLLAMHSAVETMGVQDQIGITKLMREYFSIV